MLVILELADKDPQAAQLIIGHSDLTTIVAFHCQQCLEKSFKSLPQAKGKDIPRIHNLITLYGLFRNDLDAIDIETLQMINETYIDARYPSDLGLLPEGIPSQEKANLRKARQIKEWLG